jgi:hypothetical protein
MPAVPSSPCRVLGQRPASVSGASVQCPRDRCPVSGAGVRCPCVPASAVSDRNEVVERGGGQAAARLGWPGSVWLPAVSTTGSSSAQGGAWRSKLA